MWYKVDVEDQDKTETDQSNPANKHAKSSVHQENIVQIVLALDNFFVGENGLLRAD